MNITDLADVSYTQYVVAGVVILLILLIVTNLGFFKGYHALKENPDPKKYINKPSRLASVWVGLFVLLSALFGGAIYLMMQQDTTKMDKDKVAQWMSADYAIEDLEFGDHKDTQVADDDNIPESREMITGVMDGQRVVFYVHVGDNGMVHPMMVNKEIPLPYGDEEKSS